MGLMREKSTWQYKVRQQDPKVEGPGEGNGSPGEEGTTPHVLLFSPNPCLYLRLVALSFTWNSSQKYWIRKIQGKCLFTPMASRYLRLTLELNHHLQGSSQAHFVLVHFTGIVFYKFKVCGNPACQMMVNIFFSNKVFLLKTISLLGCSPWGC